MQKSKMVELEAWNSRWTKIIDMSFKSTQKSPILGFWTVILPKKVLHVPALVINQKIMGFWVEGGHVSYFFVQKVILKEKFVPNSNLASKFSYLEF